MPVWTMLFWALWVGASAAGAVVIVRAVPVIQRQVQQLKKPWVCDVCMSLWVSLAVAFGVALIEGWPFLQGLFVWGPSYAVTKLVLMRLTDPVHLPPLGGLAGAWEDGGEDDDGTRD